MIPAQVTLQLSGLSCQRCAAAVQRALEAVPGVMSAEVTLDPQQAVVNYDAATVPEHVMVAAVEGAGYQAAVA